MGQNLTLVALGSGAADVSDVLQVAPGAWHTCALLRGGRVKCFGYGAFLGLGDTSRPRSNQRSLCFLVFPCDLVCGMQWHAEKRVEHCDTVWGVLREDRGDVPGEMGDRLPFLDLGTGFIAVQLTAGRYHTCALSNLGTVKCWGCSLGVGLGFTSETDCVGDEPDEMGDQLPSLELDEALQISAGSEHTCVASWPHLASPAHDT